MLQTILVHINCQLSHWCTTFKYVIWLPSKLRVINFVNEVLVFLVPSLLQYTNCFQGVFIWVPFPGNFSLLGPYISIWESHGSSLCLLNVTISNCLTHLSLLNTLSTQTSISQLGFPDLLFVYFCVFLDDICAHLHDKLLGSLIPNSIPSFYMHHTIFCLLCFCTWSISYVHSHSESSLCLIYPQLNA